MREWPLVGRTEVLRALREAVIDPGARGFVLAGAAGVGKSRLAAEVLGLAERAGLATARVTTTRASSGDSSRGLACPVPGTARGAGSRGRPRYRMRSSCCGGCTRTKRRTRCWSAVRSSIDRRRSSNRIADPHT